MKNVIHFGAVSLDWTLPVSKWERDIIFAYFCIFLLVAQATNQQIAVVPGLASAFVLGDQGRL